MLARHLLQTPAICMSAGRLNLRTMVNSTLGLQYNFGKPAWGAVVALPMPSPNVVVEGMNGFPNE